MCSQCQRVYLRGDSARDEESQGVTGSLCKGGRLQESGTYLLAGVNLMKRSDLKHAHIAPNRLCCLIVQATETNLASMMNPSPQLKQGWLVYVEESPDNQPAAVLCRGLSSVHQTAIVS